MGRDSVTRCARDQHARPCILSVQVRTTSWLEIDGRFGIGPHCFELLSAIGRHHPLTRAVDGDERRSHMPQPLCEPLPFH